MPQKPSNFKENSDQAPIINSPKSESLDDFSAMFQEILKHGHSNKKRPQENTKDRFQVDGKSYDSLDDMPAETRQLFDKDGNGKADMIEIFEARKKKRLNKPPEIKMNQSEPWRLAIVLSGIGIILGLIYFSTLSA